MRITGPNLETTWVGLAACLVALRRIRFGFGNFSASFDEARLKTPVVLRVFSEMSGDVFAAPQHDLVGSPTLIGNSGVITRLHAPG
ncbi:hypothetical protein [Bradyrhizobium lupini]|uniref:hypothetical protein n=1 Tax=Rhizobium lupini TaxID=136996 RepID=UPI0034C5EFB1